MQKCPIAIYFVAAWCLYGLLLQSAILIDRLKVRLHGEEISQQDWSVLQGTVAILAICQVVWLVQLRSFSRWFSIVFFVGWTLMMVGNLIVLSLRSVMTLRVAFVVLLFCVLNVASAWYLSRSSFRKFAYEFAAERARERHSRRMQKASQERIQTELRADRKARRSSRGSFL